MIGSSLNLVGAFSGSVKSVTGMMTGLTSKEREKEKDLSLQAQKHMKSLSVMLEKLR